MAKNVDIESNVEMLSLGLGHSLIVSHLPQSLTVEDLNVVHKENDAELGMFGLFNDASANFNTYFPNITEEDLHPKEGEFIVPVFRALSEVVVNKSWNPADFSDAGVLKAATKKLVGQTVYPNHEALIGNQLGVVVETAWQNSYKTKSGLVIPAGINAALKIDGKLHPGIVRAINMTPPAIHSTSVTVEFAWKQSHEDMDREEFYYKLGTYDEDGQLVRKVATEIRGFHEISLVPHGADRFAQKIGEDGQIVNPEYAIQHYSREDLIKLKKGTRNMYFFDYKDIESFSAQESTSLNEPNKNNTNNKDTMKEAYKLALVALALSLGYEVAEGEDQEALAFTKEGESYTVDHLKSVIEDSIKNSQEVGSLRTKINDLEGELATAKAAQTDELGEKVTSALRGEVTEIYKKVNGADASEEKLSAIQEANYGSLVLLKETYQAELDKKFPMSCSDCGSTSLSRASHEHADDEDEEELTGKDKPHTVLSEREAFMQLSRKKTNVSTFAVEEED